MDPHLSATDAIAGLDDWITTTADTFSAFHGSMRVRGYRFSPDRLREFLGQLRTSGDVLLTKEAIGLIAVNYWTIRRMEDCLRCKLRPQIESDVDTGKHVIHVPFGNIEDSSTLLHASPFKGENLNPHSLFEFLFLSKSGALPSNPSNSVICFIDDNTATGRQAPAVLAQWAGIDTPDEERHVRRLPTYHLKGQELAVDLWDYFKEFDILFAPIYASPSAIESIRACAKDLDLTRFTVSGPAESWGPTDWKHAVSHEKQIELQRLFERYGVPLLEDKIGHDQNWRRSIAKGYDGHGRLFLFWYQTPTSMPVMFWRYGYVNGKAWKPLFWRESNYERFIKRFNLWPHMHEKQPELAWAYYQAFVSAKQHAYEAMGYDFGFDAIGQLFEEVAGEVGALIQENIENKLDKLKIVFVEGLENLDGRAMRDG